MATFADTAFWAALKMPIGWMQDGRGKRRLSIGPDAGSARELAKATRLIERPAPLPVSGETRHEPDDRTTCHGRHE
jgi:hypothetical protein